MNPLTSLSDIYRCVVDNCVKEHDISGAARELWLDPLVPVKLENNTFVLATNLDFKRETLNSIYLPFIEEQLKVILGVPVSVEIIVDDNLSAQRSPLSDIIKAEPVSETIGAIDKKITYTFDNFIVGPSNNLAFAAAKAVSKKQHEKYNPLFIYGDSGLGKTHLLSAIECEMKKNFPGINIIYIPAETFTNEFLHSISTNNVEIFDEKYRSADALLIDDIQFIAGKEQTEEKFFHIFNELYNQNKVIVLTSDRPAKEIKSISDRLRTRFSSGLAADVKPPEYETRLAIIQRKAELLHFNISEDVIDYIATKLKSNIRQIEGVVTKLNALYMVSQVKPTIAVAQNVIKDIVTDHQPIPVTVDKIIGEVAKIYNVEPDEMRSQRRTANISQARKVAIYVIQDVTGQPYEAIGQEFNGRDHSTVVYAIKSVKEEMERDSGFRSIVEDIIKNIKTNQ
ncbi:MAG: chromosomal replication initiator protein DnaA [Lachnospiraceae bacterium]|nr:chromosomal replication initiator protein DnaA [Ruminococcus sp.]MCM1274790.1 chromosomal replication initiator protein DnaA [Lachnospiraceae bacterium]